jgi:hypothetical protein
MTTPLIRYRLDKGMNELLKELSIEKISAGAIVHNA